VSYLYDNGRNRFLIGAINWTSDTIRCILVDAADYTANQATDQFYSSVTVAGRVGTQQTLANKTASAGVADADDVTFPTVTGDPSEYIVLWKFVTADTDSPLIALIDSATGLPVTPNGGDILVQWSNLTNKIFKL
jgi:hypothetical protein